MADVNLLFPSPVKPENLLIYYMGRSILPALGGSLLFIIYGASQMADKIDLSASNILFLMLGFSLFFFMISPLRFLIYTLHTKYGVMDYIKNGVIVLAILLGAMILIPGLMAEKFWQGMFSWISSSWFDFFPIVGWSRGIMSFLAHGNWILSMAFAGLYVVGYFVVLRLVLDSAGYYYEDVLEATKSNEEQQQKAKGKKEVSEGNFSFNSKKQLALPDFGIGAKAFYWRSYVHSSRQDFHPLFGIYSLVMVILGVVFAVLSNFDWFSHKILNVYILILIGFYFLSGISRASIGDLRKPYFFLIPASWSSKLWNIIKLDLMQITLFSIVLIVPAVLIAGLHWALIPIFPIAIFLAYMTGLSINMIPKIGLEEGWDQKLIKPVLIGGVFLFGIIPTIVFAVIIFILTNQFVWTLLTFVVGLNIVAGILIHVLLDILSRLEFKEVS
ncbi:Putative ABC exporter [Algoriphagus zhangzhouensis]|uniref:Putative ABC exporter n=1 Tax=Algoriphagus zhangzhouensis TaxID=1073327 RepID=A0A1M7ZKA1_9BACT|nr:Putative ABC exporter [Algoriphagus zhangzhouensis]